MNNETAVHNLESKKFASVIKSIGNNNLVNLKVIEQTISAANASQLLILKRKNVITDEEYRDLRQKLSEKQSAEEKSRIDALNNKMHGSDQQSNTQPEKTTEKKIEHEIQNVSYTELSTMLGSGVISLERYDAELKRRKDDPMTLSMANPPTGIPVERRNYSPTKAKDFITQNVPLSQQKGLLDELQNFKKEGEYYSVSIRKDNRGYGLVRFELPNPWTYVKKNAEQSVTQSVRHELGKGGNRLINPDYVHNEMINQYKLVRDALPAGTTTHKLLEKTDKIVTVALTGAGLTVEAVNLLVNAVRGALLESPQLKYKVAALIPDDLVRQGATVNTRLLGNNLRTFIHKKYNLPDRPRHTPVLVNTLDQIKPEHYRAQDAQKVGITMRDLTRENAIKFIHENVPVEKQESAIETINRLQGNQFGVSIMDSGWVRIDASAREPRTYDNRPQYDNRQKWVGSFDASVATKMP
ncbi:MAG: hypothetical protein Q8L37_03035 [Candidatus Gottesmanbacteria bacterium]|nr:hypothetical protein [Candidatus Gottesmanbacteria bacterium]